MTAVLAAFILARVAEDEEAITSSTLARVTTHEGVVLYADAEARAILRRCTALRAVVERQSHLAESISLNIRADAEATLRALASIYADHEGWREEWRLS